MPAESSRKGAGREDFADKPVYQGALRLCGLVYDLEPRFPDDERAVLFSGLKRASTEIGSLLAAGFGRGDGQPGRDLFEQARSRLMEARHYVLLAKSRYFVNVEDVEAFEAIYAEVLDGIEALLAAGGAGAARAGGWR